MPVLNLLAGLATGVLSAFGIGGGTLLLLYLTFLAGFSQQTAQGINLLYFLPTAGASLPLHLKRGAVDRRLALVGGVCGCAAAIGGSLLASILEPGFLRQCFGVYLIATGCVTLFGGKRASGQ
ncbi:MAG: sulfite exporter TauE/SafE family protein [Clostridiales bacterium]|nr:sulfite exporter TauE/SafE family protein [Clostridiales bacterium]MCD8127452.1 sulfite exporter TauE/SafE family protein [Clostridiales bacterium]